MLALVVLIALDGMVGAGIPKQINRFGGAPAQVQAVFIKSPGQATIIEASIFLDGDKLLAPLGSPVPLVVKPDGDPRLLEGSFDIPLPEVKKPAAFRVVLSARSDTADPTPCGDFRIVAYPNNLFSEGLPPADSLPEVAIAGKFPGLRELLDKNQIRHRDINLKMPDSLPPGTIVVAEIPADARLDGLFSETRKLIFASGTPPSIPWILDAKAQSFLLNTSPPEDFRKAPLAQQMLLALLR